jgi:hypothetical protein
MKNIIYVMAFMVTAISSAQDYSSTISAYLYNNRTNLNLQEQDVQEIEVSSYAYSKSMQLDVVHVSQKFQGIEIANTSSSFAVKNGAVVNANLSFEDNLQTKISATTPAFNAAAAVSKAAAAMDMQSPQGLELLETLNENSFVFNSAGISRQDIPVRLIYHKTENTLVLSWEVGIYTQDGSHYYLAVINAVSGELIHQGDLVISCNFGNTPHQHSANDTDMPSILFPTQDTSTTMMVDGSQYRVFAIPVESPIHGTQSLVIEPADPLASPFGWHDTNGAVGPEFTITRGNNVYAQEDFDAIGTFGASPDGGATLDFDFPQIAETTPRNNIDGATINLFYWNNVMHDVWYQYGFDEASGNFQENNYGNGGSASDSVIADAQDGAALNNATFFPPGDGQNGGMNMFLWTPPAGLGQPLTITNGPLAGTYNGVAAVFGDALPMASETPLTGTLALLLDNDAGVSTDPNDACDTITNAAALNGNIAVLRRGECEFGFKALNAENAGAIAVIVVNNAAGNPTLMSGGDNGGQVTIPVLMVSQTDGEAIIAALENGDTINVSLTEVPPFAKDGSLDNGIIAHEYGHGISTRLTGGRFNPGCLSNAEQMGEGWSDWFGLMMTLQPGQDGTEPRGIGTYVTNQTTTGSGIRPFRYSTNTSINPTTYGDTNNGSFSQPHGIGSIWAQMIWDLNWRFIDDFGFDADLYNGTGGNNMVMQLVTDGLKLQACSPGFVNGRDAILEADELANGGANRCRIWETFAARGVGASADQGSSNNRSDQTEAFDVPNGPDCTLGTADNNYDNNFRIYPNPSNGNININSIVALDNATISIYDVNGRQVYSQEMSIQDVVNVNAGSLTTGVYVLTISGDNFTHTSKIIIE